MIPAARQRPGNSGRKSDGNDESLIAFWERAMGWVEANRKKIISNIRKYMPYSPYAGEDFLQAAYLAAFEAARDTNQLDRPDMFEQFFWVIFRRACCKFASYPSVEKAFGYDGCKAPVLHVEYVEHGDIENAPTDAYLSDTPETELLQKHANNFAGESPFASFFADDDIHAAALRKELRSCMRPEEATVWEHLLGLAGNGGCLTLKSAAEKLGYNSRQAVAHVRDRGLQRLKKSLAAKPGEQEKIPPDFSNPEVRFAG